MDWSSDEPPDDASIAGAALYAQAQMHIKTIVESGSALLGHRSLELDGIEPFVEVSHRMGGPVWLQQGYAKLRRATRDEAAALPVFSTWGYRFIVLLAEKRFSTETPHG